MELSVLLHHRDFLRCPALQQRRLTRYFSLTERRFTFMIGARPFQPEFEPVTKAIGERTGLFIFPFLIFAFILADFRRGDSVGAQRHGRVRGPRNNRQFHRRLFR
ncbi:hypothetical protein ACIPSE_45345 [Streptomyces sp. NPDC090106]|uniref:hypothetical protein n=1 Tax=Streptomyces sp. NPDC090106 TaxID=3365946 RepID=UPI003807643A